MDKIDVNLLSKARGTLKTIKYKSGAFPSAMDAALNGKKEEISAALSECLDLNNEISYLGDELIFVLSETPDAIKETHLNDIAKKYNINFVVKGAGE